MLEAGTLEGLERLSGTRLAQRFRIVGVPKHVMAEVVYLILIFKDDIAKSGCIPFFEANYEFLDLQWFARST